MGVSPRAVQGTVESVLLSADELQARMFPDRSFLVIEVEVQKVKTAISEKEKVPKALDVEVEAEVKVEDSKDKVSGNADDESAIQRAEDIASRMKRLAGSSAASTQLASILSGKPSVQDHPPARSSSFTATAKSVSKPSTVIEDIGNKESAVSNALEAEKPTDVGQVNSGSASSGHAAVPLVEPEARREIGATGGGVGIGLGSEGSWGVVTHLQLMQQSVVTVQQSLLHLHGKVTALKRKQ